MKATVVDVMDAFSQYALLIRNTEHHRYEIKDTFLLCTLHDKVVCDFWCDANALCCVILRSVCVLVIF